MNEDSPLIQYIKQLENPTQEGFSVVTNRWYSPKRKGFDSQQYGYGLDKNTNNSFREFLTTINRNYITPKEETKYRLNHINGYLTDIWNKRTKGKTFSDKKKMMAYGLMYHGHGPKLWNKGNNIYETFWNGTDDDMIKAVSNFYKGLNTERSKQHDNYWKNYKEPTKSIISNPNWQSYQFPIQFKQQGGQFMNNTVKKFKQKIKKNQLGGLIQKFQKKGKLPTAPSAEERYKNSKRTHKTLAPSIPLNDSTTVDVVRTEKPWIGGKSGFILRAIDYSNVSPQFNDTTFMEAPPVSNPLLKVKTRGMRKQGSYFQTPWYFFGMFGGNGRSRSPQDKQEYETLKRRFNTAWNLAK